MNQSVNITAKRCKVKVTNISTGREGNRRRARIYFWLKEETILENLFEGRHTRPYIEFKKLIPQILKAAGLPDQKVRWSQRAGCSCLCSPGFVTVKSVFADQSNEIHVDYEAA